MLDEIIAKTRERLDESKKNKSIEELKAEVQQLEITQDFPFKKALSEPEISIIAEVKRASPSKGLIADDFDYLAIAKDYENAGASAISVLTEPYFFMGSDDYLKEISQNVSIPILRKDFVIDEYMIWEAKQLGASAVLLIVSILSMVELKKYLDLAHDLGLSAIVEAHDATEIRTALNVGAEIIGVNNRDLTNFTVDIENSISLRRCVSGDVIFISESGIKTPQDVRRLKENTNNELKIIKAIEMSEDNDLSKYDNSSADYLLLDSGKGSGKTFDWQLIRTDLKKEFFLAGGINSENVKKAIEEFNPYAIDLSSSLETDGYKDENKIKDIMEAIN